MFNQLLAVFTGAVIMVVPAAIAAFSTGSLLSVSGVATFIALLVATLTYIAAFAAVACLVGIVPIRWPTFVKFPLFAALSVAAIPLTLFAVPAVYWLCARACYSTNLCFDFPIAEFAVHGLSSIAVQFITLQALVVCPLLVAAILYLGHKVLITDGMTLRKRAVGETSKKV